MADNLVAIVTGGARGIGLAAAHALAANGLHIYVNDTGVDVNGKGGDPAVAQAAAAAIRDAGGMATDSAIDARTADGARAIISAATAWAGVAPTVLVHAAGTLRDGMLHRAGDDDWAEVMGAHLGVGVELTRAMAAGVRQCGYGRFVYLGGAAGLVGNAGQASYVVAKAGLIGLVRAVALEMANRDVCVNYVAPFAATRMTATIPPITPQLRSYLDWADQALPEDVAPLIAWLASPAASGVTGQVFGARGAEVTVWSQSRPAAQVVDPHGWTVTTLDECARPTLAPHFTPLESEFDLFSDPPQTVRRR